MALYDHIGATYDTTRRADPYLAARLRAHLAPVPGGHYLDLACGSGNYTAALAATGVRLTGVDQSARMIAAATPKSAEVAWHVADANRLPFADGEFAGALCTLAIHHFPDPAAAFREVARVVPRGRFVLLTSDPEQMRGYWLNAYFPDALARAIAQMPPLPTVTAALAAAGFRVVAKEPYAVAPDLQDFFLYSGKHRPAMYLDPAVRAGISTFSMLAEPAEVEAGCARLAADLATGRIAEVVASYLHDGGDYVFLVAASGPTNHVEAY